jgi:hypothetical protein
MCRKLVERELSNEKPSSMKISAAVVFKKRAGVIHLARGRRRSAAPLLLIEPISFRTWPVPIWRKLRPSSYLSRTS